MNVTTESMLRADLSERRRRLVTAIPKAGGHQYLRELLGEVDAALGRIEDGSYGLCEVCHDPIERDRLYADPLSRFCLDHLNPREQRALQQDLDLAARVQAGLLPPRDLSIGDWSVSYHFRPLGAVSGDHCDVVPARDGSFHFLLGDVSGKGVAASMLMSHLHALFRTLIASGHPLPELMERASRAFCESTLPTHFATLVCGLAGGDGEIEICNAGHPPPLLAGDQATAVEGDAGLPLGIFSDACFASHRLRLERGETLVLYTDGVLEASDPAGAEYGLERALAAASGARGRSTHQVIDALTADLETFRQGAPLHDDIAIMAVQRVA